MHAYPTFLKCAKECSRVVKGIKLVKEVKFALSVLQVCFKLALGMLYVCFKYTLCMLHVYFKYASVMLQEWQRMFNGN